MAETLQQHHLSACSAPPGPPSTREKALRRQAQNSPAEGLEPERSCAPACPGSWAGAALQGKPRTEGGEAGSGVCVPQHRDSPRPAKALLCSSRVLTPPASVHIPWSTSVRSTPQLCPQQVLGSRLGSHPLSLAGPENKDQSGMHQVEYVQILAFTLSCSTNMYVVFTTLCWVIDKY